MAFLAKTTKETLASLLFSSISLSFTTYTHTHIYVACVCLAWYDLRWVYKYCLPRIASYYLLVEGKGGRGGKKKKKMGN